MLPPAHLTELINQSSLTRYAHSALPGAPVRPDTPRRRPVSRALSRLRRGGRSATRSHRAAPFATAAPSFADQAR